MGVPLFKIDDYVRAKHYFTDATTFIVDGIVQTRYGTFYHLQSINNLAITIANIEESKLYPA